jgi:hypothetical protein
MASTLHELMFRHPLCSRHPATTRHLDERYARTQCPVASLEDLPALHAQHRQRITAHVAKLAANAEKMTRLQGIGSVPPLAGNVL